MASLTLPRSLDLPNRYISGEFNEFSRLSTDFTRKPRFNYYVTIAEEEEKSEHEPEDSEEEEDESEHEPEDFTRKARFNYYVTIAEEEEEEEEKSEHEPEDSEEEEDDSEHEPEDFEEEEEEEFSFSFPSTNLDESPISADEAFQDGQIRPAYSIFDQSILYTAAEGGDSWISAPSPRPPLKKLFAEERDPSSAAALYCEWTGTVVDASPEICRQSCSTGFSKIWKLRDGKDAFEKSGKVVNKEVKKTTKTTPSAQDLHSMKSREVKRQPYLPFRQGVVGLNFKF